MGDGGKGWKYSQFLINGGEVGVKGIIIKETDPGLNKKEEWGNRNVPRERKTNANNAANRENLTSPIKKEGSSEAEEVAIDVFLIITM